MQRVVRSSLIGLLAMAGLTACGDKVEVSGPTTTPPSLVVRSVTVTPPSATLNSGDKITLAASVNADAGVTDRTVTWRSGNTAIASVDANGVVTAGTTAGTTTISALAKADTNVRGASVITVNVANQGGGAPATVTVSTINQTVCVAGGACSSVPANLGNVAGQIDVTLNVDPGAQRLVGVDLVLNCTGNGNSGQDTVVASQTLASSNVVDAEAASAPVTLSFNTASFNGTTGATAFRNGQCTIKGRARTNSAPGGAITTVTSTSQNITLNNNDVVIGSLTSTKTAINPTTGLLWNGGDVTVTATPVMFSGRVPATMTITYECRTQTVTGTGTKTVTYVDGNDFPAPLTSAPAPVPGGSCVAGATPATGNATPAANDIDNITNPNSVATFTLVDAAGAAFTTNPCGAGTLCTSNSVLAGAPVAIGSIRLDTQKPLAGTFALANNADQGIGGQAWVGSSFRFAADSAAGFRGPDATAGNQTRNLDNRSGQTAPVSTAGVDAVTYVFQSATSATGTFSTLTAASSLDETATNTSRTLRIIATDALGNADTAFRDQSEFIASSTAAGNAGSRFGVDKTAPTMGSVTGVADQTANHFLSNGVYRFAGITDNLSGTGTIFVAQVRNWNGALTVANNGGLDPSFLEGRTYGAIGGTLTTGDAVNDVSPCIIGRFNQTQAKAGLDAVPAFDRGGAQVGFCTPVPFALGGGTDVFVNNTAAGGYFKTVVVASDQAGNRTPAFTATVLENLTTPTVANIDMPASITGNGTASFPASVTETSGTNVGDIVASWATLNYTGVTNGATANSDATANVSFRFGDAAGPGVAFDNVMTRTATVTPSVSNFFKSLTVSTAQAGNTGTFTPVSAAGNNATSVTVSAKDPAINANGTVNAGSATGSLGAPVQLVAGASSTFDNTRFTGGFRDSVSTATVSACSGTCAAANPTSVTIFAIAQGQSGTFNNPFAGGAVTFWYRVAGATASTNPWFFISSTTSGVTSDTGNNTLYPGRAWIFSTTWTPPAQAPDGTRLQQTAGNTVNVQIRAVGVNTNGDAVATLGTTTIALTNP